MQLLKSLIILIVGFVLLIKGADFFVEGSSAVAKRLDHRSHGYQPSGMCSQCNCFPDRQ